MDSILLQFHSCSFANRIERKFTRAVNPMEWQRDVPGHTRDVDDAAAALFAHHRNHSLHGRQWAEEVGLEKFVGGRHVHLRNGVEQAVSRIVDPNIDSLEMMQGEAKNAIDLFRVANVAREGNGALRKCDTSTRRFCPGGDTREQDHIRTCGRKSLGNRLPDTHGSACDYDYLSVEFHARVVCETALQVKVTSKQCRTIG